MNARLASACTRRLVVVWIAFFGIDAANSLWIPVPRDSGSLTRLLGRIQRPTSSGLAPLPVAVKRGSNRLAEPAGSNDMAIAYAVDTQANSGGQSDGQPVEADSGEADEFDIDKHWPITPRACFVLMKILHAQTAEIIEQGNSDTDFYEAASYYQPAIRTLAKCMDVANRGYENVVLD